MHITVAFNISSNSDCHDSNVDDKESVFCIVVDVVVLVVVVVVDVEVGKVIVISSIVVKLNDEKSCSYKKMSNGSKDMLSTSIK